MRELIKAGHITQGEVDERSIEDILPADLRGYTQCHFFAGIGVWSYALRRAGWADDRPVWTGSCPCQPFSAAGKGGGFADERHLWPAWFHLICAAKPRGVSVFGEQVASKDGLAWLGVVHVDLEGQGYTVRAVDLCAAGFGAPHIRQRLFFVADTSSERRQQDSRGALSDEAPDGRQSDGDNFASSDGADGGLAFAEGQQYDRSGNKGRGRGESTDDCNSRGVEHAASEQVGFPGCTRQPGESGVAQGDTNDAGLEIVSQQQTRLRVPDERSTTNGHWRDADWLPCIDGKARPVEPGTFPLAHGAPARVGRLRGYGNAIVAEVATEFIKAYLG